MKWMQNGNYIMENVRKEIGKKKYNVHIDEKGRRKYISDIWYISV